MYQIFKIIVVLLLPFALSAQNNVSLFDKYMKAQFNLYGFNGNILISKRGLLFISNPLDFPIMKPGQHLMITACSTAAQLQKNLQQWASCY